MLLSRALITIDLSDKQIVKQQTGKTLSVPHGCLNEAVCTSAEARSLAPPPTHLLAAPRTLKKAREMQRTITAHLCLHQSLKNLQPGVHVHGMNP